jgi:hypothetical protein
MPQLKTPQLIGSYVAFYVLATNFYIKVYNAQLARVFLQVARYLPIYGAENVLVAAIIVVAKPIYVSSLVRLYQVVDKIMRVKAGFLQLRFLCLDDIHNALCMAIQVLPNGS